MINNMVTKSKSQTQKLAKKLAKKILRPVPYALRAKVIALSGNLGSGKTTFTQGFIKALGVKHQITSPTFVIFRKYHISPKSKVQSPKKFKNKKNTIPLTLYPKPCLNVYHFDLYRINKPKEVLNLGFKKIINNPENIVLIEWPELIKKQLPKNTIWVKFEHGINKKERIINIK